MRTRWGAVFAAAIVMLFCMPAFAQGQTFDTVYVHITTDDIPTITEGGAAFSVSFKNGAYSEKTIELKRGKRYYDIAFDNVSYTYGDRFTLTLEGGARSISCGEQSGKTVELEPYLYENENKETVSVTHFYINLTPEWEKETYVTVTGSGALSGFSERNGVVYIPEAALDTLFINHKFSAEDRSVSLTSQTGGHTMRFWADDIYAVRDGVGFNLTAAPFMENGVFYIPLYEAATHFACNYKDLDTLYERRITLTPSVYASSIVNASFINGRGISSRTNYLIWISKSDFKLNVYLGSKGAWRHIKSIDCAIGAPGSPTIEGSFEYYQQQPRWTYSTYYCGPIMRFHGPYAIHSTLIRYSGEPYDNRVRARISHGCVRVRPDDIKWLVSYIPLNTRVYVTA